MANAAKLGFRPERVEREQVSDWVVAGYLVGYEPFPIRRRDGTKTYKHELVLERPGDRGQYKIEVWHERVLDLTELRGTELEVSVQSVKESEYGRRLYASAAVKVILAGRLRPEVMKQYETELELEVPEPRQR